MRRADHDRDRRRDERSEAALNTRHTAIDQAKDADLQDDTELTEERMRRALGLAGPSPSRTLTADGGASPLRTERTAAPETLSPRILAAEAASARSGTTSPLRQRVAELEQQLALERQRHAEAHHLLQQAQLTMRALEARTQQNAITQQAELELERQAIVQAQRTLDEALFDDWQRDRDRRSPVHQDMQAATRPPGSNDLIMVAPASAPTTTPKSRTRLRLKPAAVADATSSTNEAPQVKKRGRPRIHPLPEPKPVRWWTPAFKAKAKR